MDDRRPNNRPWVILGVIGGLIFMGVIGVGIYSGAKSVYDQEKVVVIPSESPPVDLDSVITIYVDENDNISLDGERMADLAALETGVTLLSQDSRQSTYFILRFSEKATHTSLVNIRGFLDEQDFQSKTEIIRSPAE